MTWAYWLYGCGSVAFVMWANEEADTFCEHVGAILMSWFWPVFLVYAVFKKLED